MPERPAPKPRAHPWTIAAPGDGDGEARAPRATRSGPAYAELHVTSNFTFLTGASHPEELVERAAQLGHAAVAITDLGSLAGIVRAHVAAKEAGIPLAVGSRLALSTEHAGAAPDLSVLVFPTTRAAYGRLCRLLTLGKLRAEKGECHLALHDLIEHEEDLLAVALPPPLPGQRFLEALAGLRRVFDEDRLSLAASRLYGPDDADRIAQLAILAEHARVPLVATNDVHYHDPGRRALQDVLACIRHGCTVHDAGFRLMASAERHLKVPEEMARLFAGHPAAVARAAEVARRAAAFSLDELRYEYPDEVCPAGRTPIEHLRALTEAGARERYPRGVPEKVRGLIAHELALIEELAYAPYFLTVHDLIVFARSRNILCQGRGAAANSAVCYCLGVTAVDPGRIDLLFERFVSRERNEPPDIDIDFEHERREEVIQYLYRKYGRARAALTAEVISYRARSAVREVGKALGFSLDAVDRLARNLDWWQEASAFREEEETGRRGGIGASRLLSDLGFDPRDGALRRMLALVRAIIGFPRHLSQHVGGFVITRSPLSELVPIENAAMPDRTVIEWDKDDVDAMGMLKVDVLGLGMLTCIRKSFDLVNARGPGADADRDAGAATLLALHTVPPEDPAVYDMVCSADTVGVFQIESRAQMSMLPRLRPRCFYDLVIEVAIVRPGPIQGDMVHPYLRRRRGEEPVSFPDDAVRGVLGKTLGVPLFQEQAMALAIVAAGFTPGEADQLRRAMAAWKRKGDQIARFGRRLVEGMTARGYAQEFAERCFRQIQGFSEYGFPESHAASFALLVYVSAWLKRHHPAAFAAALLNSQPMGFYAPAQIVADAKAHGVEVRPVDANRSDWDCTLEETGAGAALRLGMRMVKGMKESDARAVARAVRGHGPFATVEALRRSSGASVAALRRLASADAFTSMGLGRQRAQWALRRLHDKRLALFDGVAMQPARDRDEGRSLPAIPLPKQVVHDYAATSLSLKAHPLSFLRDGLARRGVRPAKALAHETTAPTGRTIAVAGLVLVRQRPATAAGIIFMTLEDETGIANLIVRPHVYQRYRAGARHGVAIVAQGKVEREGAVVHVLVRRFAPLDHLLADLTASSRDFH
jgi:error-prone DNA polymerase